LAGKGKTLAVVAPVLAAAAVCAVTLVAWLAGSFGSVAEKRVPVVDRTPMFPETAKGPRAPLNTGTLIPGPGAPADSSGSWPQFRGADRSNVVRGSRVARAWGAGGLDVVWETTVGMGHAGVSIHNGRVYLTDYDKEKQEDAVRCLSFDDGREIWRFTYSVRVKQNHGMSRTVAAVNDRYVVSMGPKCHVFCLDAKTGRKIWSMDLVAQFGTTVPPWYTGQCPLIEADRVVLAPGGEPLMMAVELETGKILWQTPNPGRWGMTHSSVVRVDFAETPQYVYCTTRGVVGVSAADGKILWTKEDWRIMQATVPTPVVVGHDRIFFTGGYNKGCAMIRLTSEGGRIRPVELFRKKPRVFGADQQTPIFFNGFIYGVIPGGQLACIDLDGNQLWTSGRENRYGLGPFIIAGGVILALNDQTGTLHMVDATPDGFRELARAKVLDGHDAWAPMAMADGKLILRDLTHLVCLEIPKGSD